MSEFEFTDRYKALGIPYPDPATMCKGQCEGTGWVPVYLAEGDSRSVKCGSERDPVLVAAWKRTEACMPSDDGWHFVKCPECGGTGKVAAR